VERCQHSGFSGPNEENARGASATADRTKNIRSLILNAFQTDVAVLDPHGLAGVQLQGQHSL
jgi:hypothetical protein